MLDLSLFRNRTFGGANAAMLFVGLAMFGTFFYVSLYMQNVLNYSPVEAGASFLPMTILIILIAPRAGALTDRVGSRWLVGGGMTLLAVMLLYYSQLGADESFWALLPGLLLGGIGMGMTMTPVTAAAMSAVAVDKAGVGSAVLNSARQVGGSLGIAVMGSIVAASSSYLSGFHDALRVGALLCLTGAIVAATAIRKIEHGEQRGAAPVAEGAGGRRMTASIKQRLPAEARRQARARRGVHVLLPFELPGRDDGGDRARGGDQRADPLPPLRVEARSLPRVPRRGVAELPRRTEQAIAEDPERCLGAIADAYMAKRSRIRMVDLWIQSLAEASDDSVIAAALRKQVREVHDFFAEIIRDGQRRGVIHADRDAVAEAWLFVAGGLLTTMDNRLGGLLGDDLQRVRNSRRAGMLGRRVENVPGREKAPAAAPGAFPGQAGRQ